MRKNRIPVLLPSGSLLVRTAVETEGVIGETMTEVLPGTSEYKEWVRWMYTNEISPSVSSEEEKTEERLLVPSR